MLNWTQLEVINDPLSCNSNKLKVANYKVYNNISVMRQGGFFLKIVSLQALCHWQSLTSSKMFNGILVKIQSGHSRTHKCKLTKHWWVMQLQSALMQH